MDIKIQNKLMGVFLISLLATTFLYLSSIIGYSIFSLHQQNCNTGIAPCFAGTDWLVFSPLTGWIVTIFFSALAMKKLNIPRITLILLMSELTFICSIILVGKILGFLLLPLIRPLIIVGYYFLFNTTVPAIEKRK